MSSESSTSAESLNRHTKQMRDNSRITSLYLIGTCSYKFPEMYLLKKIDKKKIFAMPKYVQKKTSSSYHFGCYVSDR